MALPHLSVIIPAFRAQDTLPKALHSIHQSGLPDADVEIVIASDDGQDYARLLAPHPALAFTPVGPVRSGAGAARNRALAQARGRYIAFLDADDTWEPGYLATLLPLAHRHGTAFGLTAIHHDGQQVLRLPRPDAFVLTLEDFGRTGASYHPVLERSHARVFTDHPSQDVRHAVELLARLGGEAALGASAYNLHISATSTTADSDFTARVAQSYDIHIAEIEAGAGDIPEALRQRVAQVFRDKASLNAAFQAETKGHAMPPATGQGFYDFVAARLRGEDSCPATL